MRLALAIVCLLALAGAACGTPGTAAPGTQADPSTSMPGTQTAVAFTPVIPTTPPPAASATPDVPAPTPTPSLFTLALPAGPGTLDPAGAEDEAALLITRHLYEGLTAFEPGTTRVRPALAQSWQTSANGLVWTFRMRPDVVFSDGTPLTAEVARRNFERWLTRTPAGRYAFWRLMFGGFAGQTDEAGTPLSTVAAVTATTPSTLVLTLNRPDSALPNTLAMPAFALVNPDAWEASGFGGPGAPSAGTGPFTLVAWSAAVVQLERNPAYWGTPAKPDGLLFKGIADDVQRLTALQVGEVDGLARLPPSDYDLAARWPALRVEFDPPLEVLYLGINQARAPWDDLNCRLAVALAMDPARYARDFFPGDAEPATAMQPPSVWGYAAPSAERAPDLAQAQELWQACLAAQPAPPVEITFYVPPIPRSYLPDPAGLGSAVQTDLASAGITVTVRSPDWTSAWLPEVQAGHADLFLLGWAGVNGDPDAYLCPLFCGLNAAFNSNQAGLPLPPDAGLARLLQEAHTAASPARREQLYAQAHARIFESVPAVPLAYRRTAWAFRVDLAGSVPSPIENVFFGLEVRPAP